MKKDGPLLANILLDSIKSENLQTVKTQEPGVSTAKRLPTHPVRGQAHYEGVPMAGAVVTLVSDKGKGKTLNARGVVEADGSFQLSTYKAFDGAPAGEYEISVVWREGGKTGANLLPAKYATAAKSGLRATIKTGMNEVKLELTK